jgi:hypothetical protein
MSGRIKLAGASNFASLAPLRELYVSLKGAKLAKRRSVRLVFGCGYAALGISWFFIRSTAFVSNGSCCSIIAN